MKLKLFVSLCITFFVIWLFHYTEIFVVKLYPVFANLTVFLVFFISTFSKETVIQKFAKAVDGELSQNALIYTRKLTYIWSGLTFFNFIMSLISVFMSTKFWAVYNGFIAYLLIGTLFFVEYIIRIILKKKNII